MKRVPAVIISAIEQMFFILNNKSGIIERENAVNGKSKTRRLGSAGNVARSCRVII